MHQQIVWFSFTLLFSCHGLAASEIAGLWKAYDDAGKPTVYIRILEKNGEYIGVIEKGLPTDKEAKYCTPCRGERKNQPLIGLTMMQGVVAKADGEYMGKEILDPFTGHTYRVKLTLKEAGKTLLVRGFIGMSLFGRTQKWRRVENE